MKYHVKGGVQSIMTLWLTVFLIFTFEASEAAELISDSAKVSIYVPKQQGDSPTIISSNRKKLRVNWNPAMEERAVMEPSSPISMEYALDAPFYSCLNEEEKVIFENICRLGVRIYATSTDEQVTLIFSKAYSVNEENSTESETSASPTSEIYIPLSFDDDKLPKNQESDFKRLLNDKSRTSTMELVDYLSACIRNHHLIKASLLISKRPEAIDCLSGDIYTKFILTRGVNSVLKHFIFRQRPQIFMNRFISVYRGAGPRRKELCDMLMDIFIDLLVDAEAFKAALSTALATPACPMPILRAFVSCQRGVSLSSDVVKRLATSGLDNIKDRVQFLVASNDAQVIVSILEDSILQANPETSPPSVLVRAILASKPLINLLPTEFVARFVNSLLTLDNFDLFQTVFTSGLFVNKLVQVPDYKKLLVFAALKCNSEIFLYLSDLRLESTGMPIFSRKDLVFCVFKSIFGDRLDIAKALILKRHVSLYDRIAFKDGTTLCVLGLAVKKEIHELFRFVNVCGIKIDWKRCPECASFLKSKASLMATACKRNLEGVSDVLFFDEAVALSSTSPPSRTAQPIYQSPVSSSNSTCQSPEMNDPVLPSHKSISPEEARSILRQKRQNSQNIFFDREEEIDPFSKIPRILNFTTCLARRDDEEMKHVLERDFVELLVNGEDFIIKIIEDLLSVQLVESLNFVLERIKEMESMRKIVIEFAVKIGNKQILEFYLQRNILKLTDRVLDRNVIAQLLKFRHSALAFDLMETFSFNVRHSDSPDINPDGDILLSAVWSLDVMRRLLELGASPEVILQSNTTGEQLTLLQWAQSKGKTNMAILLATVNN